MSKSTIIIILGAIFSIQGQSTLSPYHDIIEAANVGNWDKFQYLLLQKFGAEGWKDVDLNNIRNLQPPSGGHVYGESEYTFHSSSDNGVQKSVQTGGHKIINDDGKVHEFDFKPKFDANPLITLQNKFKPTPAQPKANTEFDPSNLYPNNPRYTIKPRTTPRTLSLQAQMFRSNVKNPKRYNYPYF